MKRNEEEINGEEIFTTIIIRNWRWESFDRRSWPARSRLKYKQTDRRFNWILNFTYFIQHQFGRSSWLISVEEELSRPSPKNITYCEQAERRLMIWSGLSSTRLIEMENIIEFQLHSGVQRKMHREKKTFPLFQQKLYFAICNFQFQREKKFPKMNETRTRPTKNNILPPKLHLFVLESRWIFIYIPSHSACCSLLRVKKKFIQPEKSIFSLRTHQSGW